MLRFYAVNKDTLEPYTENGYVPTFPHMFRCDNYWVLARHPRYTLIRHIDCPDTGEYIRDDIVYLRPDRIQVVGSWDRVGHERTGEPRKRIVRLRRT